MTSSPRRVVGPFVVTEELDRYGAGSLFRALDPAGTRVLLVAVRGVAPQLRAERLAGPTDGYRLLPGDGPDRLWAVFASDAEEQARHALRTLGGPVAAVNDPPPESAPAPDAQPGQSRRPEFEPPSKPAMTQAVSAITPGRGRPHARRVVGVGILVVLLVVAIIIAGVQISRHDTGTVTGLPAPTTPAPSVPTPLTSAPSTSPGGPTPTPSRHPLPTPGKRPHDPILSQAWQPGDHVYPMDLGGFSFSFRAPGSWGCLRSGHAGVRWVCVDETGILGGNRPAHPSGGIIESDECAAPCGKAAYRDVLARLAALGIDTSGLHRVNARTRVASLPDPTNPQRVEYRMSRVYDSNGDGRFDRHLWVRMDANKADETPVTKMLGDLYDATR